MNRRRFLERVVKTSSALIALLFALPVWSFIRSTFGSGQTASAYPIGRLQQMQEGVSRVGFTRLVRDGWRVKMVDDHVWISKKADGRVLAFEPHCTHLGCAYNWDPKTQLFLCPCHGGKFDQDGKRVAGPPPRDLDRFEIKIQNGQVKIGTLLKS